MIIDLNDIICVLKGGDAIDKVMNIFLQWTPLHNFRQYMDFPFELHEFIVVVIAYSME